MPKCIRLALPGNSAERRVCGNVWGREKGIMELFGNIHYMPE
jgi:hypothetical protein